MTTINELMIQDIAAGACRSLYSGVQRLNRYGGIVVDPRIATESARRRLAGLAVEEAERALTEVQRWFPKVLGSTTFEQLNKMRRERAINNELQYQVERAIERVRSRALPLVRARVVETGPTFGGEPAQAAPAVEPVAIAPVRRSRRPSRRSTPAGQGSFAFAA